MEVRRCLHRVFGGYGQLLRAVFHYDDVPAVTIATQHFSGGFAYSPYFIAPFVEIYYKTHAQVRQHLVACCLIKVIVVFGMK